MRIERDDEAAAEFLQKSGVHLVPPYVGLLVLDERNVWGAFIVNDYADRNCEISAIGQRCWTPSVVRYLARYIFGKLDCRRVTARTRMSNTKAKRALLAMGFQYEGRLRDWYDNEDCLVFGLTRTEQGLAREFRSTSCQS